VRLKAGVALSPLYARFPGLEVAVPASELRNQPVVSRNDLVELSARLNG
jgi:2-hydroxy-5-methyl-1-naphthoate 7-hydroxylase